MKKKRKHEAELMDDTSDTFAPLFPHGERTVALTEGVSGHHGFGLEVNSVAVLVDSTHSEEVLCVFEEPGDVACQILALCLYNDPVESIGVTSLNHIVSDLVPAILQRWLPTQSAGLFCDVADHDTAFAHPRSV